jgi:3-methyladenine DNA glycosylase AlkD
MTEIQQKLYSMQDKKYGDFQSALIPGVEKERFIGVRTPDLRTYAKELIKSGERGDFLDSLPHYYFDEMQLHAFMISLVKDFDRCMELIEEFLPYVDNWATCDQLSPKVFGKKKDGRLVYKEDLLEHIDRWLDSDKTYTVRFGIGMLMQHLLDDEFDVSYMKRVANIRSDEYYVRMMVAWYFATALAKQYEEALRVIEGRKLDTWTHNKAIQKAIESRRITPEQKEFLRTLKLNAPATYADA